MATAQNATTQNVCRGKTCQQLLEAGALHGGDSVTSVPYIGAYFKNRLRRVRRRTPRGIRTVNELLKEFADANSAAQAYDRLARLFANPNKYRCRRSQPHRRKYHISDVNECAHNSTVDLLRLVHTLHEANTHADYGFANYSFPWAQEVPYRQRGTRAAAECACLPRDACRRDRRCRFVSSRRTRTRDACIPAHRGSASAGFQRGVDTDQYVPGFDTEDRQTTISGRPHTRGWRMLEPSLSGGSRANNTELVRWAQRVRASPGRNISMRRTINKLLRLS